MLSLGCWSAVAGPGFHGSYTRSLFLNWPWSATLCCLLIQAFPATGMISWYQPLPLLDASTYIPLWVMCSLILAAMSLIGEDSNLYRGRLLGSWLVWHLQSSLHLATEGGSRQWAAGSFVQPFMEGSQLSWLEIFIAEEKVWWDKLNPAQLMILISCWFVHFQLDLMMQGHWHCVTMEMSSCTQICCSQCWRWEKLTKRLIELGPSSDWQFTGLYWFLTSAEGA